MPYILRIGDELVQLLFQHYGRFESRYKGSHSLRCVYVPEVFEDIEE